MMNLPETTSSQTIILDIDANTSIVGDAPQYINVNDIRTLVTSNMAKWSIKKIVKDGIRTTIRNAEGDEFHNKILDDWATYTY